MSLYDEIRVAIVQELDDLDSVIALSPTSLAIAVQLRFNGLDIEPHIKFSSLEYIKDMARRVLRKKYDPVEEVIETGQVELFAGQLQNRYPIPHKAGEPPIYKKRDHLSREEVAWNVNNLRKTAKALLEHGDALQAWDENRGDVAEVA